MIYFGLDPASGGKAIRMKGYYNQAQFDVSYDLRVSDVIAFGPFKMKVVRAGNDKLTCELLDAPPQVSQTFIPRSVDFGGKCTLTDECRLLGTCVQGQCKYVSTGSGKP